VDSYGNAPHMGMEKKSAGRRRNHSPTAIVPILFSGMTRRHFVMRAALALGLPWTAGASPREESPIARTIVASTSIASVGYDPVAGVLEVEFRSGAIYRYLAVPMHIHRELMSAESKGRYFSQQIRGRYRFQRITEDKQ
jgi:hypothetical protein